MHSIKMSRRHNWLVRRQEIPEPPFRQAFGCVPYLLSTVEDGENWEESVSRVVVSSHPLVHHHIATLRDTRTTPTEFRRTVRMLAVLLAQEATADLPTCSRDVTTPLGRAEASVLKDVIGIVPILRAGLGMAEGVIDLLPDAEVWHIGLYRDETTLRRANTTTSSRHVRGLPWRSWSIRCLPRAGRPRGHARSSNRPA